MDAAPIPPEIIEEILLNLPVKSLVRFSSVSKSWNFIIFEPPFARKHKSRAALLRRDRLVVYMNADLYEDASFCALSSISSHLPSKLKPHFTGDRYSSVSWPTVDATEFVSQFKKKPYLRALCDELWCVQVKKSLFLWNPSMRNYRKLSRPLFKSRVHYYEVCEFLYGLGYDSVGDDYKILKIGRDPFAETEFYSLKNNCWRKIDSYSAQPCFLQERCEFIDGRFHWIGVTTAMTPIFVSFNLLTEKYGEVAQPEYSPAHSFPVDELEVVVVRGMLCACLNYYVECRFVLWVMEEYGVEKSWTKKFDIHQYSSTLQFRCFTVIMKPLYIYDNNEILVKECESSTDYMDIVMYKNEKESPKRIFSCGYDTYCKADAFLYLETLISPAGFNSVR